NPGDNPCEDAEQRRTHPGIGPLRIGAASAQAHPRADDTDEHRISRTGVTPGHLPVPKMDIQPDDMAEQFRPGEGEANERQEDQNDGEGDAGIDGFAGLTLLLHQTFSSDSTSPRMPEGRKISTSTRMEKAITSLSW